MQDKSQKPIDEDQKMNYDKFDYREENPNESWDKFIVRKMKQKREYDKVWGNLIRGKKGDR